jgi:carboxymethylenebutenolidase
VDPRVVSLYNEYIHGAMPRRAFLARVSEIAGGVAAATALLAALEPDWARGQQVDPRDDRLETGYVTYPGPTGLVRGYLTMPARSGERLPAILVIHENRGLNSHIEDVARRAALEGYVVLAPDGLTYVGGAPADQEAARDRFRNADEEKITADILAGVPHLAGRDDTNGTATGAGFRCAARPRKPPPRPPPASTAPPSPRSR